MMGFEWGDRKVGGRSRARRRKEGFPLDGFFLLHGRECLRESGEMQHISSPDF